MRINRRIRVPEVRLVGPDGHQLGVFQTSDAMKKADDMGYDLVEISPMAKPPVCKIMDFGKFKYEQTKKKNAAKKTQVNVQLKEIKMRPSTGDHDLHFKFNRMREFLAEGHKVKATVQFRGRELAHKDRGRDLLKRVIEAMGDDGVPEQSPRFEGRFLSVVFGPGKVKAKK